MKKRSLLPKKRKDRWSRGKRWYGKVEGVSLVPHWGKKAVQKKTPVYHPSLLINRKGGSLKQRRGRGWVRSLYSKKERVF